MCRCTYTRPCTLMWLQAGPWGQGLGNYAREAAGTQAHRLWFGTRLSRLYFYLDCTHHSWCQTQHGPGAVLRVRGSGGNSLGAEGCVVSWLRTREVAELRGGPL